MKIKIQIYFLATLFAFTFLNCTSSKIQDASSEEEWISLFNGQDLSNWTIKVAGQDLNFNYKNTFVVEDEMIRINYEEYEEFNDAFGHMYYNTPFSYYKLQFEYRFVGEQTKGGASWNVRNSGVMLHSQSAVSNDYNQGFPVSIELQMLGGLGEDDGERTTGNVCTPGTAVMMGDTVNYNHCINSISKTYHGDQWVQAEAIVHGGDEMTFLIEGDTVLQFQRPQVGGGFISQLMQGRDWDQFGIVKSKDDWLSKDGQVLTEGYISLQAESHPIDFKNIRLLNLCGCMDKYAKNYRSYYVKDDKASCQY